jgi:hypothetical protein
MLSPLPWRHIEELRDAAEAGLARQIVGDLRHLDRPDRIHHDVSVLERVPPPTLT